MHISQTNMIRKIIVTIFTFILLGGYSFSQVRYNQQYLDSLSNVYLSLRGIETASPVQPRLIHEEIIKCGTFLVNDLIRNFESFSPSQQMLLKPFLQRPTLPYSIISPSGFFRIHFDTTGSDKIGYDLNLLSQALDSSYKFEVNYLGFLAPPLDNGEGGDNKYDVYVQNLGSYGQTVFETEITPNSDKFTSYMEIDNDFNEVPTKGINGARVTVAHELHHAIQGGNYIFRDGDRFFYELTSTSMEEFVYDDVNDYYFYLPSYFFSPQKAFAENDGYNLALWNIFLKENFGFGIIKKQWELMPTQRAMNAINTSITEAGSSFKHELNKFGVWTFYTKYRAIPGKYFEEASFYPLIRPLSTIAFTSPDEVVTINSKATANNFICFNNQINNDTLFVLITNGDVQGVINNIGQTDSIAYYLFDYPESGASKIDSIFYSKFTTKNLFLWSVSEISDTIIIVVEPQLKTDFPYPMPFSYKKYSEDQPINIPISATSRDNVGLYIFSTAMELVYSNDDMPLDNQNKNVVKWKVKDNHGRKLASGVYIYVIKSDDNIEKGKLVILHD